MPETVYLVGAGVNRSLNWEGFTPPLSNDFFTLIEPTVVPANVADYISQYWGLSRDELSQQPFNLEELFTQLQLQIVDATNLGEMEDARRLSLVVVRLENLLADYLQRFRALGTLSWQLLDLAKLILRQDAPVLTFNYDSILESALENAAGPPNLPPANNRDEQPDLTYCHYNWNPALAYGLEFGELDLPQPRLPRAVLGPAYYSTPRMSCIRAQY